MSFYSRTQLSNAEKAQVQYAKNKNGEKIDPNSKKRLEEGKIDLGHKYGLEERVMQKCAKRCGLTSKEYHDMMRNPRLYQWEDQHENRSHKHECKNYKTQLHKCMQVVRSYKNKDNGKNKMPSRERNKGRTSSWIKSYTSKVNASKGRFTSSGKSIGARLSGRSGGKGGTSGFGGEKGGAGGKGGFGGGKGGAGGTGGFGGGKGGAGGTGGGGKGK